MKDTLAAEKLPSDEDEVPELSEDPKSASASQSRSSRVKRQIVTALYETQESTYHPQPSSLNTHTQALPLHVPPPFQTYTHIQALPHQYQPHLSQTSFQRMLESDDDTSQGQLEQY